MSNGGLFVLYFLTKIVYRMEQRNRETKQVGGMREIHQLVKSTIMCKPFLLMECIYNARSCLVPVVLALFPEVDS